MSIGAVSQLWRFPVKSLQGERCESLRLTPTGFEGDRRYAVVDRRSGRTLTAKTVPELLFASARTDGDAVVVTLADGRDFDAADPTLSGTISESLDRECDLVENLASSDASYDMTFDPEHDDADLVNIPIAPGTFFDLTPLHALTSTSLAAMRAAYPEGEWDVRRFRPNLFIEASGSGFPEDDWVGSTIAVGEGGASFHVVMPSVRCAIPNRAQPSLGRDLDIFRTMDALHANHLGVYCEPRGSGPVHEGDELRLQE